MAALSDVMTPGLTTPLHVLGSRTARDAAIVQNFDARNDATARLVELARNGDRAACDVLVRRHFRATFAVALSVLNNVEDAEDIAQEALLTALQKLEQCREGHKFVAWLLRITRNRALNALRSRRLKNKIAQLFASKGSGTASTADPVLIRRQLVTALQSLPLAQRELVLLHDLDGWSHAEIAREHNISEGMSRQLLFQARKQLRSVLGDEVKTLEGHNVEDK